MDISEKLMPNNGQAGTHPTDHSIPCSPRKPFRRKLGEESHGGTTSKEYISVTDRPKNYHSKITWEEWSRSANEWFNKNVLGQLPWEDLVEKLLWKDHKWYNNLIDGDLKDETLMLKAKFEESWGDAALGFMEQTTPVILKIIRDLGSNIPTIIYQSAEIRIIENEKFLMVDVDDEYVAVKEHEYFDHSRTNVDACQAYREPFHIMHEGWLVTKAKYE
ncbi:hypothetical protein Tco_0986633 [Tanacetum coccineum]